MSYQANIMNIPCRDEKAGAEEHAGCSAYLAYKHGHRDARHEAAEIAVEADREIAEAAKLLAKAKESMAQIAAEADTRIAALESALAAWMVFAAQHAATFSKPVVDWLRSRPTERFAPRDQLTREALGLKEGE